MSGYTEACNPSSGSFIPTLARDGKGQYGPLKYLIHSDSDLTGTKDEVTSLAWWNTQVAAGKARYIGEIEEFVSNNSAATFYESPNGNVRVQDVAEKRIEQYRLIECACTAAEISRLNGLNGRLWFLSSDSYVVGKSAGNGLYQGQKTSQFEVGLATRPIIGTPVSYLPIDVTFATPLDDQRNPFDAAVDFLFSDLDEVNRAFLSASTIASTPTNFTFSLAVGNGCQELPLTGVAVANMKFTDLADNVLVATVTPNGDNYDVDVTTTSQLPSIKMSIDGIQTINSLLYASDEETVTV